MKRVLLAFLTLLPVVVWTQALVIPDVNFKSKLLQASPQNSIARNQNGVAIAIDTNHNGAIEINEADAVFHLDINNTNSPSSTKIVSLEGLEAFNQLRVLFCQDNSITSIPEATFASLNQLGCRNNPLETISLLSATQLQWLDCRNTQLQSLSLAPNVPLVFLDASHNQLTQISGFGLAALSLVNLRNNPLTTLSLNGATALSHLTLSHTFLTYLDVSIYRNLVFLDLSHNMLLTQVNLKNGSFESGLNLSNTPQLHYICTDESTLERASVLYQVALNSGSTSCEVNSYCTFIPGGMSYALKGMLRLDTQNDGCQPTDAPFTPYKIAITASGSTQWVQPSATGSYNIGLVAGSYSCAPVLENPNYFSVNPTSVQVHFPTKASPFTTDFCVTPNGNHADMEVFITPLEEAFAGYSSRYKITCKNKGTTAVSGMVIWNYDTSVCEVISSFPEANSDVAGQLQWQFDAIAPGTSISYTITHLLNSPLDNPPLVSSDVLEYTAQVSGFSDVSPLDNTFTLKQTVVNSMDPNNKICLEGTSITPDKVGDYIHYLIRFENLGTSNARNVVIHDVIDASKLNMSSIVALDASHPYEMRVYPNQTVDFIFENINLPFDDASNDGYVLFKIKTQPTLTLGDVFSNTAAIHFDYNAPIITNTFTTTVQALSLTPPLNPSLTLFPNPTKGVLFLNDDQYTIATVYDFTGRQLAILPIVNREIDTTSLVNGTYLLRLEGETTATVRFCKSN
ncbi:T9SS type A sorting domain-containing protein [Flavobacterium sp.]|uniref:DUF7619 domain-containing protein n=1 Tax=Flavobacterium sp. TaxID=239 RepID=UPI00260636AA|nr:T9SS type A sorting domain-containing protein [Flavobacterium sp.]